MVCEAAAYMFRELYALYYSCAIKTSNNQMIRSYPVGNCAVPWQDNWKNIQWKLQPTEISMWSGNCWRCWARCCSPGSPAAPKSHLGGGGEQQPPALVSNEEGKILEQAILVFWFSFTLVIPPPRYTKRLIPDFLPLAPSLWPAMWNVFLLLSACQLLSSVKNN